jgi:hypothetical protein
VELYKILVIIFIILFFVIGLITDGFDWLSDDEDVPDGGIHP